MPTTYAWTGCTAGTGEHRAEAPLGRRPLHLLTTALALAVPVAGLLRRRSLLAAAAAGWAILTADFSWRRIRPGPRDPVEVLKMITTSVAIPPAATWHWVRALLRPETVSQ